MKNQKITKINIELYVILCKAVCIGIFALTIVDLILTRYGLFLGVISEGNPLMVNIVESPLILVVIAIIMAGLFFAYKHFYDYIWIKYALTIVLVVKLFVVGLHINWLMLLNKVG